MMINLSEDKRNFLSVDAGMIRKMLTEFYYVDFAGNLNELLKIHGITDVKLAEELELPVKAVHDWRFGDKVLKDRERFKEIGLCLSMTEGRLSDYLLSLGYTRLYPKNPLDKICLLAIKNKMDPGETIRFYRENVKEFRSRVINPRFKNSVYSSGEYENDLNRIKTSGELEDWLLRYAESFKEFSKAVLPNKELILYATLFCDPLSIVQMYETGELPDEIRDLISVQASGKGLSPQILRNKLIHYGLLKNMNDKDIDRLLKYAHVRQFTSPETAFESALLLAVRCAHQRFPVYVYDYLVNMSLLLSTISKETWKNRVATNVYDPMTSSAIYRAGLYAVLIEEVNIRLKNASCFVNDYYGEGKRSDDEFLFENLYTGYSKTEKKCLADFVGDVMYLLAEDGEVDKNDVMALFGK
ncbi:MAG: hypothetical protein FWH41_04375 [Treponema sp.]|nr:hypothetical protein [Treponema sp.]